MDKAMRLVILGWGYPECRYFFYSMANADVAIRTRGMFGATFILVTAESAREDYGVRVP